MNLLKESVIKIFHPSSERIVLYLKAVTPHQSMSPQLEIIWAHLEVKKDNGFWKRKWIDMENDFWGTIKKHGFPPEEVRIEIDQWLEHDHGGIL